MAERSDPWPTMTLLGILCGIALGAVVVMLWRRSRDLDLGAGGELDLLPASPPPTLRPVPSPFGPPIALAAPRVVPIARTMRISATRATLLMRAAGPRDFTVWVRVVGPPGSFADFRIDNEAGNAAQVLAGQHQQMMVPAGQSLYAIGSTSGVSVSVSGGPA